MAADYDFRRKPNEKGDGEVQPLYPLNCIQRNH